MKPRSILISAIALCASGVFTIAAMAEPNAAQNLAIIDERLKQLSQQIEALQFDQQQIQKQIADLQTQVVELRPANGAVPIADLQALEAKIKASDAAREKDKQIILDAVAKEIAAISGRTSGSATPPPTSDGKEYVVQKGEYLSNIAKKYGVSVADIVKANKLANPDDVKPGQKLVIPK